jgi:hypothetical protein
MDLDEAIEIMDCPTEDRLRPEVPSPRLGRKLFGLRGSDEGSGSGRRRRLAARS